MTEAFEEVMKDAKSREYLREESYAVLDKVEDTDT